MNLHLFGIWQGQREPDDESEGPLAVVYSKEAKEEAEGPVGLYVAALDELRQFLEKEIAYPRELVNYHVGWFQQTLDQTQIDKISLLRLDGDWYESTKYVLNTSILEW